MSVLFLPPSATSVPDATEAVSGKIRIATSAEATAGTLDSAAMTPLKVKSVVDAAVVGGVTYQGTFNTSAPVDLSNAQKGDLYIISVAGSYQGQTWAVGDHLLVNADMGGTISPSKIDKVDNTDAVTSVAGKTGAVTLVAGDVSGLAAVATSGAYSDLSGTPTLATVATTGAYSDLSGTPTLGTAAAEDVGTLAGDVVQLDGSARLPAVDGSQLINLPSATVFYNTQIASLGPTLSQITDSRRQHYDIALCSPSNPITMPSATSAAVGGVVSFYNSDGVNQAVINCPTTLLLSGSSVTSVTVEPYESRSFVWIGASALQEITATRIDRLNDVSISSPSGGEALVFNGTLSVFENATVSASVAAIDDIGDVTITGVSDREALVYDSGTSQWVNGSAANTVVESFSTTPASTVVIDTQDLHEIRMTGSGGFTVTISATADGLGAPILFNNTSTGDCTLSTTGSAQHFSSNGSVSGSQTTTIKSGERRLFYVMNASRFMEVNATDLDRLADVSISSPSSGQALVYNGTLSVFENATISAGSSTLGALTDVDVTGAVNTNVLKYNSTSGDWEDGAVAYSEVTGTPALATVATTGAYSDLSGTPTNVSTFTNDAGYLTAITGESVGDLSDVTLTTPSAGQALVYNGTLSVFENSTITATVSALNDIGDVSAAAPNNGDVIAYNSTSGDWEATAQSGGGGSAPTVSVSSPAVDQTLSAPSAGVIEEVYIYTPSAAINVNLVAAATVGSGFKYQIKNRASGFTVTVDPNGTEKIDGAATFDLDTQESSVTIITDGSNWFII